MISMICRILFADANLRPAIREYPHNETTTAMQKRQYVFQK